MAVIPTKNPSPTSVQGVINKAPTTGYTGVQNQGMYRLEVGGKTIDTGNSNTLANLLKQGGKIISHPGQQQQPQQPAFDSNAYAKQYQDQINNMYNQRQASQMAQIRAHRDKAVGEINQQKAQVAPQYQGMRNQADVVNTQQVQKLREMMAANGLQASGENVSASVGLSNQRQANLNSLNLQEQQTMDDYNRRIADVNNPNEELAMITALESERARALLDMGMRADEIGYSRGRDSIMDGRYADETAYNRGRDTVGDQWRNKEWDYQMGRDKVADGRYDQEWNYQQGRDKIEDNRYADETKYNRGQDKINQAWREYQFKNMSASEKAQLEWAKSQFGEEMAWKLYDQQYQGELSKSQSAAELEFYKNMGFNPKGGGGENQPGPESFQKNMSAAVKMGVPKEWVPLLTEIVKRESSFNPKADNPKSTAYGYGQFLDATEEAYEKKTGLNYDNPVHQLVMMAQYVKDRYKTPENALAFWNKNKWY